MSVHTQFGVTRAAGESSVDYPILREREGGWELMGACCSECGTVFYPPRALCPHDLSECSETALSPAGLLYSFTRIDVAPQGFDPPYWIGYVDLDEGVRVLARIRWRERGEPLVGNRVTLAVEVVREEPATLGPVFEGPA